MSFKKSIKKISVVALLALTASPVCGQDLLARQAPVDHRMKSLDTLAVSHYRMIEDRENPAAELYEDFVRYEGGGYGKYIVIRHNNGLETIYGHLSKQLVTEGEEVRAGDVIGLGGNTGRSTGSHLHFETRLCGVALNPALFFDFRNQDVTGDFYSFNRNTYESESADANAARGKVGNGGYTREQVNGGEVGRYYELPAGHEKLYHKVKPGETLSSIAEKRGVSVEQICRLNGYRKDKKVSVGQIIRYV